MRDIEQIVGREAEIESLERFVVGVDAWPGALVIEGAAGIGKNRRRTDQSVGRPDAHGASDR